MEHLGISYKVCCIKTGNSNSQRSTAQPAENALPISSAPVMVLLSDMFKPVALCSHKSNEIKATNKMVHKTEYICLYTILNL